MILCDSTFLATHRGRILIERALARGYGDRIAAPASYFDRDASDRLGIAQFGLFRPRSAYEIWGGAVPEVFLVQEGSEAAGSAWSSNAAQVWLGLRNGWALVARRTSTFDELVAAGVDVTFTGQSQALERRPCLELGEDLGSALLRRVRFIAVADHSCNSRLHLRVLDRGRAAYR